MVSPTDLALGAAKSLKDRDNRRAHTVVRTCGEEHTGRSDNGTATVYIPTDPELEYIAQLRFKVILGNPLGSNKPADTPAGIGYDIEPIHSPFYSLRQFYRYFVYPDGTGGVNMDGAFGYQCWDLADFFWVSNCHRTLQTGPSLYAYEIWTVSRAVNQGTEFSLVTSWNEVKAGDWVIYGPGAYGTGHVNLALEDSDGGSIRCLGQNQQNANLVYGHVATVDEFNGQNFIGAFRFRGWDTLSPYSPQPDPGFA